MRIQVTGGLQSRNRAWVVCPVKMHPFRMSNLLMLPLVFPIPTK